MECADFEFYLISILILVLFILIIRCRQKIQIKNWIAKSVLIIFHGVHEPLKFNFSSILRFSFEFKTEPILKYVIKDSKSSFKIGLDSTKDGFSGALSKDHFWPLSVSSKIQKGVCTNIFLHISHKSQRKFAIMPSTPR